METWGDQDYIGLTGVELFGADGNMIQLPEDAVSGLCCLCIVITLLIFSRAEGPR